MEWPVEVVGLAVVAREVRECEDLIGLQQLVDILYAAVRQILP
jgi:hypothetical protein